MSDILTPEQRSRHMARIRGRDTKPELLVRRALHARGFRYRLHAKELPGRPDMVFPRRRAVVLVHGCFWHGHDCPLFRLPGSRREFWEAKISGNRTRDGVVLARLLELGWRALQVWECGFRGPGKLGLDTVIDQCEAWLRSDSVDGEVRGVA